LVIIIDAQDATNVTDMAIMILASDVILV